MTKISHRLNGAAANGSVTPTVNLAPAESVAQHGPVLAVPDQPERAPAKTLLVASSGGHLMQLLALEPWWRQHNRVWVSFDSTQARSLLANERVRWAYHPTTRNVPNLLRNALLAARLLLRDRPDLVVSTGAGVALPFFVVARLLRIPTAFIEVYDRIDMPTLTGRLVRPFATVFLAQWEEQRRSCPGAIFVGPLL